METIKTLTSPEWLTIFYSIICWRSFIKCLNNELWEIRMQEKISLHLLNKLSIFQKRLERERENSQVLTKSKKQLNQRFRTTKFRK